MCVIKINYCENATVKITLSKRGDYSLSSTKLTAKLGTWDVDYDVNIAHSGSIKLRGTIN